MIKYALAALAALIIILVVIYTVGYYRATKLPDNRPAVFILQNKNPEKKVVVCIGDSITHGRVSCNYVDILSEKMEGDGFIFVNAGINSELAWNALQRVDEVIRCDPDYITILIGSNDANGSLRDSTARHQMKEMKLPQYPDREWFRKNLSSLCDILRTKTKARIALLSLPPIGEDNNHEAFRRTGEYSAIIKEIAAGKNVSYIPLHENMRTYLADKTCSPPSPYDQHEMMMYKAIFMNTIMGTSFNDISTTNGFSLMTDYLHLNCKGATMTADLIENFLLQK
ncbi:MAG: SGNH/GDSL hydrolase family protein [Spirochaetae bacterium HGW-Spirochaetae-1]|jgi:lysophospholipase L1-like esterase|nr:MAG: SGNH/GDSL hydrolase family protein [Spirochaetae bacterium HGW-Spirochaetae-1]